MIAWVALICRFTVGLLFLFAGPYKLPERDRFQHAIENYRLLPDSVPRMLAFWLPPLEIAAGVALLVGLATRLAALLLAAMLGVFILGVGVNLLRGRKIDCGCIGGKYKEITWAHVIKNSVLEPRRISRWRHSLWRRGGRFRWPLTMPSIRAPRWRTKPDSPPF